MIAKINFFMVTYFNKDTLTLEKVVLDETVLIKNYTTKFTF